MKRLLLLPLLAAACTQHPRISTDADPRVPQQNWNKDSFKARVSGAKTRNLDLSSPIKIISSSLTDGDAKIVFKNTGKKTASVVVFKFNVVDAFGQTYEQSFSLNVDRQIAAGEQSSTSTYVAVKNARKLIGVEVEKIAFTDGTTW